MRAPWNFILAFLLLGCASGRPPAAPTPSSPVANLTPWAESVLYSVLLDRFADGDPASNVQVDREAMGAFHGGDLKGLTANLDQIADLGVTALSISPVVRNVPGSVSRGGFPEWAYRGNWADDVTALDPRFGSEDDLRALVGAAHRRGIRVLLDVVYNHVGYDSKYLRDPQTKGWLRAEAAGTCGTNDVTSCVNGLPDLRTEVPAVRDSLLEAYLGLAQRTRIDGFRLIAVKHVDQAFWREHRARTRARLGKDFFLLGDAAAGDAMDAALDATFRESALAWLQGQGRTVDFDAYLKGRQGSLLSHFLSSDDGPGTLFQLSGNRHLFSVLAVLQMSVGGMPMVHYGEEVAMPDTRGDMPWGARPIDPGKNLPRDESMRAFYRKMIGIRRAHPGLSRGAHVSLSQNSDLLVFLRRDEASKDAILVAVNRGEGLAVAEVNAPAEWGGRAPTELLSGEPLAGDALRLTVALPPKSARVYAVER